MEKIRLSRFLIYLIRPIFMTPATAITTIKEWFEHNEVALQSGTTRITWKFINAIIRGKGVLAKLFKKNPKRHAMYLPQLRSHKSENRLDSNPTAEDFKRIRKGEITQMRTPVVAQRVILNLNSTL